MALGASVNVRFLQAVVPSRLGASGTYLLALHSYHLVVSALTRKFSFALDARSLFQILLGYVSLAVLFFLGNMLTQRSRPLQTAWFVLLLALDATGSGYLFNSSVSADFGVVLDNASLLGSKAAFAHFWEEIDGWYVRHVVTWVPFLLLLEWRFRIVSGVKQPAPIAPKVAGCAVLYVVLCLLPIDGHDELLAFARSAKAYYAAPIGLPAGAPPYPFVVETPPTPGHLAREDVRHPHVFLLLIESFNGLYVEARSPEGREYTPYFNALLRTGLYAPRFYANSVQTTHGHFATLFSVLPPVRGKVATTYPDTKLHGLPSVMRDAGYATLFFQAYDDLSFDNTEAFLERNGMDACLRAADLKKPEDSEHTWGWGPEDAVTYRRLFEHLDAEEQRREQRGAVAKPWFVTVATIMTHVPFDVPPARRPLYPEPVSTRQRYANALNLADGQLEVFFHELRARAYLEDSVVVILGDHSFPTGEHGITMNELGFYEENFRTPLLLVGPRVQPRRLPNDAARSQLDVAPTIVDLAAVELVRHHFQGHSVLRAEARRPVYLEQPYDGTCIGVVDFPYKYVRRHRSGEEWVFDLARDPNELENLVRTARAGPFLAEARTSTQYVWQTLTLLKSDRIWDR